MLQISNLNKFSFDHPITGFSGKDYQDSMRLAEEWASRNQKELLLYFCQITFGKSILVSYKDLADDPNP